MCRCLCFYPYPCGSRAIHHHGSHSSITPGGALHFTRTHHCHARSSLSPCVCPVWGLFVCAGEITSIYPLQTSHRYRQHSYSDTRTGGRGGWVGGWGGLVQQLVPRPSFGFPLGESEKVPVYCQLHPPYSTHPPTQPLLFLSPEQVPCRSAELIWWLSWRRWMASVWCTEVVTPWKSVNTL